MLSINKNLFQRWEKADVKYCHWKSNEHLDEGLNGLTDMDVLVHIEDKEICINELKYLDFLKVRPQKGARYLNVEEWIGFDNITGKLVHLHLHYKIVTGKKHIKEYVLPWDEYVLSTRIKEGENNVYIADANIEIFILYTRLILKASVNTYIKALLGKFSVPKDYQVEIDYLKRRIQPLKLKEVADKLFSKNSNEIIKIIKERDISAKNFLKLDRIIRKELEKNRKYSFFRSENKSFYYKNSIRIRNQVRLRAKRLSILRKTLPQKGISIAFLGADGSGKSTISREIIKWLSWKMECQSFYLGSGDHYRTPYSLFVKWIQYKAKETKKSNKTNYNLDSIKKSYIKETGNIRKIPLVKKIYDIFNMFYLLNIAKNCNATLDKSKRYTTKGGISIYDRFPQIQYEGINDGPKISARYNHYDGYRIYSIMKNREEELIREAVDQEPDLVFKLLLTPEVSVQRKPDHDFKEVARKVEIINSLKFNNAIVFEIDATQEYEKELLEVKKLIWDYIIRQSY